MGQCHQQVVIAKVSGQYRVLAILHYNWLCGLRAVQACLSDTARFSNPANRSALLRDMRAPLIITAWEKDIENFRREPTEEQRLPEIRHTYPFVMTCMSMGSEPWPLPLNWTHDDILDNDANNEGITVMDISEPERVRVGFVFFEKGIYGDRPVMKVLNALEYVRAYGRKWKEWEEDESAAEANEMPLVAAAALEEIWPGGGWQDLHEVDLDVPGETANPLSSLQAVATERLIREALTEPQGDLAWLADAEVLPFFWKAFEAKILRDPEALVAAPNAGSLLSRIFTATEAKMIDLSPFTDLPVSKIRQVLAGLPSINNSRRALQLPNMDPLSLTTHDLENVLEAGSGRINGLDLGQNGVSTEDLLTLAVKYRLENLSSPALYHRFLAHIVPRMCLPRALQPSPTVFPCGSGTPFPLAQVVYFRCSRQREGHHEAQGSVMLHAEVPEKEKEPARSLWEMYHARPMAIQFPMVLPLRDALLSPHSIVTRLPDSLAQMALTRAREALCVTGGMYRGISMASSIAQEFKFKDDTYGHIHPIPAELYTAALNFQRLKYNSSNLPPRVSDLNPGEWTLFIFHEHPQDPMETLPVKGATRIRYGFVTLSSASGSEPNPLTLHSMPSFLASINVPNSPASELTQLWDAEMSTWTDYMTKYIQKGGHNGDVATIGQCEMPEVEEALKLVQVFNAQLDYATEEKRAETERLRSIGQL